MSVKCKVDHEYMAKDRKTIKRLQVSSRRSEIDSKRSQTDSKRFEPDLPEYERKNKRKDGGIQRIYSWS
jgi:hypothetical protein